jgi:hypothetical protein
MIDSPVGGDDTELRTLYFVFEPNQIKSESAKSMLKNNRGTVGDAGKPQIHTENFKKWFGDFEKAPEKASKVVDESGKPLVVYHGTNKNFGEFKNAKTGQFGPASYFTKSKSR